MMPFMSGLPWLWLLAAVLVAGGVAAVIAAAFGVSGTDDDALGILRARFARGEIDADAFDKARATLGAEPTRRQAPRRLLIVGIALLIAGALTAWLTSAVVSGPGGMMGGMMRMMGTGPTAPPGTSVTMAGARFTPATISITTGEIVRWLNDDAMPHTVTASDRAWDSGNLPPGGSFDRLFESPGSYPYGPGDSSVGRSLATGQGGSMADPAITIAGSSSLGATRASQW